MSQPVHALATLSFARVSEGGSLSLWDRSNCDNLKFDNREGRRRAQELLDYVKKNDLPFLLGHVIEAIVAQGNFGTMERAFIAHISECALRGMVPGMVISERRHLRLVSE